MPRPSVLVVPIVASVLLVGLSDAAAAVPAASKGAGAAEAPRGAAAALASLLGRARQVRKRAAQWQNERWFDRHSRSRPLKETEQLDADLREFSTEELYRLIGLLDMMKANKNFERELSPRDLKDLEYLMMSMN